MASGLTIGQLAKQAGVSATTIRFYEAAGILPAPERTTAGYRWYAPSDVRRLRLIRRARALGLALPAVKELADRAFASSCADFAQQLLDRLPVQRAAIDRRIAELMALRGELEALEHQARHELDCVGADQLLIDCPRCPLIDEEGGECGDGV